jgi:hypothetical protein
MYPSSHTAISRLFLIPTFRRALLLQQIHRACRRAMRHPVFAQLAWQADVVDTLLN